MTLPLHDGQTLRPKRLTVPDAVSLVPRSKTCAGRASPRRGASTRIRVLISRRCTGLQVRIPRNEREFHRKVAAECFNRAWDLLERRRSGGDDLQLLHLSHASRYHWGLIGTPRNRAIGEWQLSRVYSELGHPELALQCARACLTTCKDNGLTDILHTAYEAIARAHTAAQDYRSAERYLKAARRQLGGLSLDEDDRKVYLSQIEATEQLIKSGRTSRDADTLRG